MRLLPERQRRSEERSAQREEGRTDEVYSIALWVGRRGRSVAVARTPPACSHERGHSTQRACVRIHILTRTRMQPLSRRLLSFLAATIAAVAVGQQQQHSSLRSSSGWRGDKVGDACLPKDVINLVRGDAVEHARKACGSGDSRCSPECNAAVHALSSMLCFPYLTQSQRLQPRHGGVSLAAMAGIWYGLYPASGIDLLEVTYDPTSLTLSGKKLTGNQFVQAGRVSWEATPSGCRVVSSAWAGQFTPRWDPCTLTMWEDRMEINLGSETPEDTLHFVRARASLLLDWDEPRAPMYGLGEAFARCGVEVEIAATSLLESYLHALHHSEMTVVLDQLLMVGLLVLLPLLLVSLSGGTDGDLSELLNGQPLLQLAAGVYCILLCARLFYLGYLQ